MPEQDKQVTWAELFFDLVFVVAVTQVASLLHADHDWRGVGQAVVVFIPIFWTWGGTTMHGNTHDLDRTFERLGVFTVGLCGLFMALALPQAYGSRGLLFGASYWAARLALCVLAQRHYRAVVFNPYTASAFITGPLLLVGGLIHGNTRVALWAAAAGVDLIVPYLTRDGLTRISFEPHHLSERYRLFLLIALGESVAAIGVTASHHPMTAARLIMVAVAFVVACALWWVYFAFTADGIRHALRNAEVTIDVIRTVLAYGHLAFVAGIIVISTAIGEIIPQPLAHLHTATAALLFGGTALYLATFGYTRWKTAHSLATSRLAAAALSLALLPLATHIPALASLTLLAMVLISLNVVEALVVSRVRLRAQAESNARPSADPSPS
ncbi:low temperature requirement protein A [Streptomyces arenae]|uniref:low temperature requirement protein A n=1 Tax=Streptomyces arenae TaxID=29301 RepID=UPI0026585021|nr:low temperature requirement protein A [Streptomyces arenae]MCG7210118.1 low temperature requirement protein A [Streptomyces arenae]